MNNNIYEEDGKALVKARRLQERSFLLFEYSGSKDEVTRAHLPFLQNINISEDGKANLASYNLLGRAGQIFSYGGADSRRLKVDFEMSLLHLIHLQETEGFTERFKRAIKNKDTNIERDRFMGKSVPTAPNTYGADARRQFLRSLGSDPVILVAGDIVNRALDRRADSDEYGGGRMADDTIKAVDLMMYWTNLIRSSILNDSRNTVYGPPIVRLNHGPMYMNSPCLVEDYKISIDKVSNYDLETLFPHTIKVSMSLIESRTGDFGDYKKGGLIGGDNLAGWEAILDSNVLDAMNYNLEAYDDDDDDASLNAQFGAN